MAEISGINPLLNCRHKFQFFQQERGKCLLLSLGQFGGPFKSSF